MVDLFTQFILFILSFGAAAPTQESQFEKRAEWDPSASNLTCLFLTSGANWTGEMQNLCQKSGQCGNARVLFANIDSSTVLMRP